MPKREAIVTQTGNDMTIKKKLINSQSSCSKYTHWLMLLKREKSKSKEKDHGLQSALKRRSVLQRHCEGKCHPGFLHSVPLWSWEPQEGQPWQVQHCLQHEWIFIYYCFFNITARKKHKEAVVWIDKSTKKEGGGRLESEVEEEEKIGQWSMCSKWLQVNQWQLQKSITNTSDNPETALP